LQTLSLKTGTKYADWNLQQLRSYVIWFCLAQHVHCVSKTSVFVFVHIFVKY